jgi:hypothetical protein
MTRAGTPAAITPAGRERVTTLLAATTVLWPIRQPLRTTTFIPNQTSSSITIAANSPGKPLARMTGSSGWRSVSTIVQLAPHRTRSPIVMECDAAITVALKPQSSPILMQASRRAAMIHRRLSPTVFDHSDERKTARSPMAMRAVGCLRRIGTPQNLESLPIWIPHHHASHRLHHVLFAWNIRVITAVTAYGRQSRGDLIQDDSRWFIGPRRESVSHRKK